jgi:hypothetical protein
MIIQGRVDIIYEVIMICARRDASAKKGPADMIRAVDKVEVSADEAAPEQRSKLSQIAYLRSKECPVRAPYPDRRHVNVGGRHGTSR